MAVITETKFFDVDGKEISNDDVLFDGNIYHRYIVNENLGRRYLLSRGYTHDPTQELFSTMKRVGTYTGNEKLMVVD